MNKEIIDAINRVVNDVHEPVGDLAMALTDLVTLILETAKNDTEERISGHIYASHGDGE